MYHAAGMKGDCQAVGGYDNARTEVVPDADLQSQVFPCINEALVDLAAGRFKGHPFEITIKTLLMTMQHFRCVLLQVLTGGGVIFVLECRTTRAPL